MNAIRGAASRFPLATYFVAVYTVSAAALLVLGLPRLQAGGVQNPASLEVFPVLIVSVAATSFALTAATGGKPALRALWSRMLRFRIAPAQYLVLAIPPLAVLLILLVFTLLASRVFAPGWQLFGLPIGLVAGFFEEIGWTGYAYPRMRARFGAVAGVVPLGVLWGLWHLPVVDSLGAANPHGPAWPAFFAAFVALVAAVRCLICWTYDRTGSVLLAQLLHASFTGTLVLFSPPHVTAWEEVAWYAGCAVLLWLGLLVAFIRSTVPEYEPGVKRTSDIRGMGAAMGDSCRVTYSLSAPWPTTRLPLCWSDRGDSYRLASMYFGPRLRHAVDVVWRCLIVDDNQRFCQAATEFLQRDGVEVVGTASTSEEALRKVAALQPDVCLVDIDLGEESGFELTDRLASGGNERPIAVILTSSYTEDDFTELIDSSPAVGFLPKSRLSARAMVDALTQSASATPET